MPSRILTDRQGLALSCCEPAAVARFDRALALLSRFDAGARAEIDAALVECPDFVMGHAFRAGLMVMAGGAAAIPDLRCSVDAVQALSGLATEREFAHAMAAAAWAEGDFDTAQRRYGEIAARWPRDLLALQMAHRLDTLAGDAAALRARPEAALRAFSASEPGGGILCGMLAFGLQACGHCAAAEAVGRAALARDPGDVWATHAVAHALDGQGRAAEGAAFLGATEADWARPGNMMAVHHWWHLALFHLGQGQRAAALEAFDRGIRRRAPAPPIELVDVASMLWRLRLAGIEAGPVRWAEASRLWEDNEPGRHAFDDCHAVIAHLGAGRPDAVRAVLAAMATAAAGEGSNAVLTRMAGLPAAGGLIAFAGEGYALAADLLALPPATARRFGGFHARRDVIALTGLEAARRAGDRGLAARTPAEPADRAVAPPR